VEQEAGRTEKVRGGGGNYVRSDEFGREKKEMSTI